MHETQRGLSALALVALCLSSSTASAIDQDLQSWQVVNLTKSFGASWSGNLEVQTRANEDISRLGQLLLRPSLSYTLSEGFIASIGYAYVMTDTVGVPVTHEHRAWQQISFPVFSDAGRITITGRSRLEERQLEGRDETGFRYRQQFRAVMPIGDAIQGILWTETFFNFNDTNWGARSGFDRSRNFIGVSVPLREGVTVEPGYLNQYVNRRAEDRIDHVVSTTVNVKF